MMKYLQTIKEEEDHDVEGATYTNEMMQMSPMPLALGSPDKRRSTKKSGAGSIRGSFIGGMGDDVAPQAPETEH